MKAEFCSPLGYITKGGLTLKQRKARQEEVFTEITWERLDDWPDKGFLMEPLNSIHFGETIAVEGNPGAGKSRLLGKFAEVYAESETVLYIDGACALTDGRKFPLVHCVDVESVYEEVNRYMPTVLCIDSVESLLGQVGHDGGGNALLAELASELKWYASRNGACVFISKSSQTMGVGNQWDYLWHHRIILESARDTYSLLTLDRRRVAYFDVAACSITGIN